MKWGVYKVKEGDTMYNNTNSIFLSRIFYSNIKPYFTKKHRHIIKIDIVF